MAKMYLYMFWIFVSAVFVALALPVRAQDTESQSLEDFTIGLAHDVVQITTGFTGASMTVFGTKPEGTLPVIVIEGPKRDVVVRRKENIAGIWLNTNAMTFKNVPTFYEHAGLLEAEDRLPDEVRRKEHLGLNYMNLVPKNRDENQIELLRFREALFQLKQTQGVFSIGSHQIENLSNRLFKTEFELPANISRGRYTVHGYLIKGNRIIARETAQFEVRQEGLAAEVFLYAQDQSFFYAIFGVLIATFLGWGATQVLRRD